MKNTPTGRTLVRVKYTYIPPEARIIAGIFRAQATAVRGLSNSMHKLRGILQSTWEGRAKDHFMVRMDPAPGDLEGFAADLESKASQIEKTTAVGYRWEWR